MLKQMLSLRLLQSMTRVQIEVGCGHRYEKLLSDLKWEKQ